MERSNSVPWADSPHHSQELLLYTVSVPGEVRLHRDSAAKLGEETGRDEKLLTYIVMVLGSQSCVFKGSFQVSALCVLGSDGSPFPVVMEPTQAIRGSSLSLGGDLFLLLSQNEESMLTF